VGIKICRRLINPIEVPGDLVEEKCDHVDSAGFSFSLPLSLPSLTLAYPNPNSPQGILSDEPARDDEVTVVREENE
jgi:hypothetical protein